MLHVETGLCWLFASTDKGQRRYIRNTTGVIGVARVKNGPDQESGLSVTWRSGRIEAANKGERHFQWLSMARDKPMVLQYFSAKRG